MATLPGVSLAPAVPNQEYVRTVVSDLTQAVHRFVFEMKRDRHPPENVLIALKTIMRRAAAQPHDAATAEELQRIIVLAAVKSYFEHVQSAEGTSGTLGAPTNPGSHPLILVVDDDEDARYIARSYLTAFGYEVVVAAEGREVMNIARRVRPALIVLDIVMPTLDGRTVVQLLKHDPATRPIPVIAVTGVQEIADSPGLVADGFIDVLLKPVRQQDLLRAIETALHVRQ